MLSSVVVAISIKDKGHKVKGHSKLIIKGSIKIGCLTLRSKVKGAKTSGSTSPKCPNYGGTMMKNI